MADHMLGLVTTNDGEAAASDDYNAWYDNGGEDDDVYDDDDDDYYQREQSAFHLSSPTSICGSLNTTIRQGITLIWISAFCDENCCNNDYDDF